MTFEEVLARCQAIRNERAVDYADETVDGITFPNIRRAENIGIPAWKNAHSHAMDSYAKAERLAGHLTLLTMPQGDRESERYVNALIDSINFLVIAVALYTEDHNITEWPEG